MIRRLFGAILLALVSYGIGLARPRPDAPPAGDHPPAGDPLTGRPCGCTCCSGAFVPRSPRAPEWICAGGCGCTAFLDSDPIPRRIAEHVATDVLAYHPGDRHRPDPDV